MSRALYVDPEAKKGVVGIISTGIEMVNNTGVWERKPYIKINPREALGLISIMTETEWQTYCTLLFMADEAGCCMDAELNLCKALTEGDWKQLVI